MSKGVWQGQRPSSSALVTITMVCFTRPLNASSAAVSSNLVYSAPLLMVYAAQASGETPAFGIPHTNRGGIRIDLQTGSASSIASKSNKNWVIIHGALMAASWVLLFPMGIMMARHMKWILKDTKVRGVHLWFHLHRIIQVVGLICFIVGISFAWYYLDTDNFKGQSSNLYTIAQTHYYLGTIVAGLVILQVVFGFIRPKPGPGTLRSVWAAFHHWLGRLCLACAWTVVLLGIYMGHSSTAYLLEYSQWLIPVVVVMGFWVLLDVALSIAAVVWPKIEANKYKASDEERAEPKVQVEDNASYETDAATIVNYIPYHNDSK